MSSELAAMAAWAWDGPLDVVTRFDECASASPDADALAWRGRTWSYGRLRDRSLQVAAALRAGRAEGPRLVGVAIDRSPDAIAAMLGVLRTGAGYVPIDRTLAAARLAAMLAQVGCDRVLVDAPLPALPTSVQVPLPDESARAVDPNPASRDPDAVAYVMFTSGSTGSPKAVAIRHRSILRLVMEAGHVRLDAATRMLHAAPLGFDASTLEIWGPLLNGGCCVIHDERIPTGPGLAATIAAHRVDTAWLTAGLFNAVIDDDPRHLAGLRQLLVGGEALSVPHVRRALGALPSLALNNGYGPTECTTFATTYPIPRELAPDLRSIPIGAPIARTVARVLDDALQPVPQGAEGELYVGGDGLANGYVGREDLTQERFIRDPFGGPDDRLYRTGDRVRRLPDGTLEYVGRRDRQVKIRGFRIEPGEVEAVLGGVPGVKACAVEPRDDGPAGLRLVAYVVPASDGGLEAIREEAAARLPEWMRPAAWVTLGALPVTANGKLDRAALPAPSRARPALARQHVAPASELERLAAEAFGEALGIEGVGALDDFFELGGHSLLAVAVATRLGRLTGYELAPAAFYDDPTPRGIARRLAAAARTTGSPDAEPAPARARPAPRGGDVAVIGMAVRLPGAPDLESFWRLLDEGREGIRFFTDDELDASIPARRRADPAYVKARGVIDDVASFDAAFFGIPPREAELLDPQQRVFLELAWECMERAGHVPGAAEGRVGVYAGVYNATYYLHHVLAHPDRVERFGEFQAMLANEKDYVATRVAHRLGLEGPAINVFTACSTSLVAIAQAVDALRAGRCELALAGGAAITCPPASGYLHQEGSMLSPDGHTRPYSADAAGTVFSDGAAVVLLRPLEAALADGDTIHAVIRGVAINNDGAAKASFTAPSVSGQAAVIAAAHADAGVRADEIDYVEGHGTATPIGDPVEVEALTRAFSAGTDRRGYCGLGSVKGNVGHTVMAAGGTGLAKVALAMRHGRIPRTLHAARPHPSIDFAASPFVPLPEARAWPAGTRPRLAGVSAFGVGGTNAHVVLQEPPARPRQPADPSYGPFVLRLSARTPEALVRATARLADHLDAHPDVSLADAAFTLRVGRKAFEHRVAVAARSVPEAIDALRDVSHPARVAARLGRSAASAVLAFPGQGAQYARMGAGLLAAEPTFRLTFERAAAAVAEATGVDVRSVLRDGDAQALTPTAVTQPALFCVEVALGMTWIARGLRPVALVGHSVGEFAAAVIAGVMSLPDAARLVTLRGALMQAQPPGRMLAVRAPADRVAAFLTDEVVVAAVNAPGACVLAGPDDAIARTAAALEAAGLQARTLATSHAFHSPMMDGAVGPFRAAVARVALRAPRIPIVSTATGTWLTDAQATDPDYWARHLREPVRFSAAVATLREDPTRCFVECGPRATLSAFVRQHPGSAGRAPLAVPSLGEDAGFEADALALATARLWVVGIDADAARGTERGRRIELPTYPFDRRRYWLDARAVSPVDSATSEPSTTPVQPTPSEPSEPVQLPESSLPPQQEVQMPLPVTDRIPALITRLRTLLEDVSGIDFTEADPMAPFVELGLDSLTLTQAALQVKGSFGVAVTFRQLMERDRTLDALARRLDESLPPEPVTLAAAVPSVAPAPAAQPARVAPSVAAPVAPPAFAPLTGSTSAPHAPSAAGALHGLIEQQLDLMRRQLALIAGAPAAMTETPADAAPAVPQVAVPAPATPAAPPAPASPAAASSASSAEAPAPTAPPASDDDAPVTRYDVRKAFGAIARIHTSPAGDLTPAQRIRLDAFMRRYVARTRKSRDYTTTHRPHLADPRVVNGFRPLLKEITYQIVIDRSAGARMWDLDGNEYVDALNGFGMSLFGWQPPFVTEALHRRIDAGYDIGPQHPLAGEVARRVCEMTGFDRAALCNTGSEAVMGAIRIARTVTGRSLVVSFAGAYHGIFDEVVVRGTRTLRSIPAAPGIMPTAGAHVLVLDYGTPESLAIIRERAHEIAAVLVEPVQSRRPDFQPREFLRELREVTAQAGSALVFDEVVTGFRAHPGGVQALFGIRADLATYGKVVGGGLPIGVIAGRRDWMDALDGGAWQFGDDSIPTVGVTYFAGTFVRHPLALAAADATLAHLEQAGPELQVGLTRRTAAMCDELNAYCREVGAPVEIRHFASVWKVFFTQDHPLQDLLFAMMRSRGVHILDNFPCFMTTAHGDQDVAVIKKAFRESIAELQDAGFLPPRRERAAVPFDASSPPVPGARLGRDPDGTPAWFVPNPDAPGRYLRLR